MSPDVFVVKGVENCHRRVYKTWAEKKAPCVVIEVSSRSTKSEDLSWKFELYRDVMKVSEYYIYDPHREYLPTRLRAWALKNGRFVERRLSGGRVRSRELGLDLVDADGNRLFFVLNHDEPREHVYHHTDPGSNSRGMPGLALPDGARRVTLREYVSILAAHAHAP